MMRKTVLLLTSMALAVVLACEVVIVGTLLVTPAKQARAAVTSEGVTYYGPVDKWGSYGSGNGQFYGVQGIAIDSSDNVYVTDDGNHRVQKFTSDGQFLTKWGSYGSGNGQFRHPYRIAVDSSDNVYVADYYNHRVQKFTSDGQFLTKWGAEGSEDGQFRAPVAIAVDSSDHIYVIDRSGRGVVQKFTSSGQFLGKWYVEGGFDIAVDSSDNVYVTDFWNSRVRKYTSSGQFVTAWGSEGSGDGQFLHPAGVATDSADNVYVGEIANHRVQKFTSDGQFLGKWGSKGSDDGQFMGPEGIAVDSSGYVYVADDNNRRVQKFAVDKAPPRVKSTMPLDGATGVARSTVVKATFTERMIARSITYHNRNVPPTFRLIKEGTTTPVAATITYDAQTKTATLTPGAPLEAGATYKAIVGTAARDLAGRQLDQNPRLEGNQIKRWFFTVRS